MSGLPKLPPGFVLEQSADEVPPLPTGFVLEDTREPVVEARPNLSAVPFVGPALSAMGFDGLPRVDRAPDAWEPPGVLAPMQRNSLTGEVRPALPQIVDSLFDAIMAPGDALKGEMGGIEIDPITGEISPFNSTMIERAANAAGWATGGAPGSTGATVLGAAGRKVPKSVTRAAVADGVPLDQIGPRVAELGPDAVVADLGPHLRAQAAAATALPEAGVDHAIDTMRIRKAGANDRLRAGLDDTLGPAPIPSRLQASIREAKRVVGPQYDRILASAPPVDLTDIATSLDAQIAAKRGPAQVVLRDVRSMLNGADGELESSAAVLHQIREAVDGLLENAADSKVRNALRDTRAAINDLLVAAVPEIRVIDGQYRELARQSDAIDVGQRVLDSGRDAPRPVELADDAQRGALPEGEFVGPSGATFRLSQGARAEIDRVIGTNLNDRVALERLMRGDGDWNRERLTALFGADRANRLFAILARESRLAETEDAVLRAAGRRADATASSDVSPPSQSSAALEALNLRPGSAAAKLFDDLFGGHAARRQSSMNDDLLEAVFGHGDWQVRERAPMSEMPAPIEAIIAELAKGRDIDREVVDAVLRF